MSAIFRDVCGRRLHKPGAPADAASAKGFAVAAGLRQGVAAGWRPVWGWVQPGCHADATRLQRPPKCCNRVAAGTPARCCIRGRPEAAASNALDGARLRQNPAAAETNVNGRIAPRCDGIRPPGVPTLTLGGETPMNTSPGARGWLLRAFDPELTGLYSILLVGVDRPADGAVTGRPVREEKAWRRSNTTRSA